MNDWRRFSPDVDSGSWVGPKEIVQETQQIPTSLLKTVLYNRTSLDEMRFKEHGSGLFRLVASEREA